MPSVLRNAVVVENGRVDDRIDLVEILRREDMLMVVIVTKSTSMSFLSRIWTRERDDDHE